MSLPHPHPQDNSHIRALVSALRLITSGLYMNLTPAAQQKASPPDVLRGIGHFENWVGLELILPLEDQAEVGETGFQHN